jgi:L-2-hydroxyglutarate oxidase LhgO
MTKRMGNLDTEVLIIRAGVLGAATAWELSRYKTDATLVDRCVDVDWGIAKANVGAVNQGGTPSSSARIIAEATCSGNPPAAYSWMYIARSSFFNI